jgi:hypothetical protein
MTCAHCKKSIDFWDITVSHKNGLTNKHEVFHAKCYDYIGLLFANFLKEHPVFGE